MVTTKEILALIKGYVETNDLGAFSHAFAKLFYDIETTGDPDAVQLAYSIEAELAAVTAGIASESELQEKLKSSLPSLSIVMPKVPLSGHQTDITYLSGLAVEKETVVYLALSGIAPSMGFSLATSLPGQSQSNTILPPWQQVLAEI
jgi:hypothetical protein